MTHRFDRSSAPGKFFVILAGVLLFCALYSWLLSFFLLRVPLIDLDRTINADQLPVFQLPEVGHFEGILLEGEDRDIDYKLPSFVNAGNPEYLEIFAAPGPGNEESLSTFHIEQGDQRHKIESSRTRIGWRASESQINTVTLSSSAASPGEPLLVSIRAHGSSPWALSIILSIASLLSLWIARRLGFRLPSRQTVLPLLFLAILMAIFWLGGLISLDYFGHGHGRLSGMAIRLGEAFENGHFNEGQYRPTTFALPVFLALPLEGFGATVREIVHVYPVTRFVLIAVFYTSFAFLTHAWTARMGRDSGFILATLLGTFYPFIHDAFFPDVDALLIPVAATLTGFAIKWSHRREVRSLRSVVVILLLLAYAFSLKTSAIIFIPMLAIFAFLHYWHLNTSRRLLVALGLILVLLALYYPASNLGQAFQHPSRDVGVGNLKFQDTQLWHVIWGGYGHFDKSTAFSFTSKGKQRQNIVSRELGVPAEGYLRQSQAATEQVYKPGVLNALDEMPSFFLSTAWHRFQNHGLRLYRYTAGAGGLIGPWTQNVEGRVDHLDGEPTSQPNVVQEATRLDRYWRIAPTVAVARLQQETLSKAWDIAFLGLGLLGLTLLPSSPLRGFLLTGAVLQIAMISGVHVMYRYGAFLSIMALLGLAWLAARTWRVLRESRVPDIGA